MRFIEKEPQNRVYERLLEYGLETCDTLMFFTCNYYCLKNYNGNMNKFLSSFLPLLKKSRHNEMQSTEWPGTVSADNRHERNIMFFKCDLSIKDLLVKPKRLYAWMYPDFPEDLCFFREGNCWLTSSAHEQFSYVITNDRHEFDILESMGIIFDSKEYKDVGYTFFEEY